MRIRWTISGMVVAALLLAACGPPDSAPPADDLLFLRSPRGVAVVKAGATAPAFRAAAVPSQDWSTVVRAVPSGADTRLVALNPSSGAELWERSLPGNLRVKVVSADGERVALGPAGETYYGNGRRRTKLVIAGGRALEPRTITLDGNFEPEAFSSDGKALFVVKYLPARAPTRYQVRRVVLATGREQAVYSVDKELQEAMGGTARIQTSSPDGSRLYTLYTIGGGDEGRRYAFIHVLSLDEQWAHCIDLPPQFATAPELANALAVSPDGKRLYVANTAVGAVAEIDTQELKVVRNGKITRGFGETAHAALDPDGTLYVGSGNRLIGVATSDLGETDWWSLPEDVTGIQLAREAGRLYVGLSDHVALLNVFTGKIVRTIDPPGVRRIDQFGPVMPSVDQGRTDFVCAC